MANGPSPPSAASSSESTPGSRYAKATATQSSASPTGATSAATTASTRSPNASPRPGRTTSTATTRPSRPPTRPTTPTSRPSSRPTSSRPSSSAPPAYASARGRFGPAATSTSTSRPSRSSTGSAAAPSSRSGRARACAPPPSSPSSPTPPATKTASTARSSATPPASSSTSSTAAGPKRSAARSTSPRTPPPRSSRPNGNTTCPPPARPTPSACSSASRTAPSDRRIGVSDYAGILDTLLDLNEATVIGAHNARLTARKRAIVSAGALNNATTRNDLELAPEEGGPGSLVSRRNTATFDTSEEVFVEDPLDAELGRAATSPFRILEYAFDADALIAWKRHLAEEALTRVGLTPQYVGTITDGNDGYAISGTALRIRLIATDKTGRGKARHWDDRVPKLLRLLALLDALADTNGGFGRQWTDAASLPVVERAPGLPEDDLEEAQRHQALVSARIESRRAAIMDLHPDWDDKRIDDELGLIAADAPPAGMLGGFGA
jgi:hypothetical protein